MPYANIASKHIFYTLTPGTHSLPGRPPRTLLFIHGLGSSSSFFAPVIPYLTAQGYGCLALDTHGSGSSAFTGSLNSIGSIASDVCAILDLLNLTENVVVVGHSMGCIVASHLAATDSRGRFVAAVLIGPVNPNPRAAAIFRERISIVERDGMEAFANSIPTAATGSKSTPLVHAFIRCLLLGTSPTGYVSLCRAIAEAAVPQYSDVELPLLIVAGGDDTTAPRSGADHIIEHWGFHKKELQVLEGVGHWHVLEAYAEVQGIIANFLKKVEGLSREPPA